MSTRYMIAASLSVVALGVAVLTFYPRANSVAISDHDICLQHFEQFMQDCRPGYVRCLWFEADSIFTGIETVVDLRTGQVSYDRDMPYWAVQGGDGVIPTSDAAELFKIAVATVADSDSAAFSESVHVSFWHDGTLVIKSWRRTALPPAVMRLITLAGSKIDTRAAPKSNPTSNTTKAEQNGCRPHGQLELARVDLVFYGAVLSGFSGGWKVGVVH